MPAAEDTAVGIGGLAAERTRPRHTFVLGDIKVGALIEHTVSAKLEALRMVVIGWQVRTKGNAGLGGGNRHACSSGGEDDSVERRVAVKDLRIVRPGITAMNHLVYGIVANARHWVTTGTDDVRTRLGWRLIRVVGVCERWCTN